MKKINKQKTSDKKTKLQKKIKEKILTGIVHIRSTFNNTIITLSRLNGEVLGQSSAGIIGYKGTKKSTPYAAQMAIADVLEIAKNYKMENLEVRIKGIGSGRNSVLRALEAADIKLISIADVTPLPHNGCRAPKKPRV